MKDLQEALEELANTLMKYPQHVRTVAAYIWAACGAMKDGTFDELFAIVLQFAREHRAEVIKHEALNKGGL